MKRTHMVITVTRTRQVRQYEPVVVSCTDHIELEKNDDHEKVRRQVTKELIAAADKLAMHAIKELKDIKS